VKRGRKERKERRRKEREGRKEGKKEKEGRKEVEVEVGLSLFLSFREPEDTRARFWREPEFQVSHPAHCLGLWCYSRTSTSPSGEGIRRTRSGGFSKWLDSVPSKDHHPGSVLELQRRP